MKFGTIDIIREEIDKFNKRWAGLYHAKPRLNSYTTEAIIVITAYHFDYPMEITRAYSTDQSTPFKRREFRKFLEATRKDIIIANKPKVTEPVEETLMLDICIPPSTSEFNMPVINVRRRDKYGSDEYVDRIFGDRVLELYEKLGGRLR